LHNGLRIQFAFYAVRSPERRFQPGEIALNRREPRDDGPRQPGLLVELGQPAATSLNAGAERDEQALPANGDDQSVGQAECKETRTATQKSSFQARSRRRKIGGSLASGRQK